VAVSSSGDVPVQKRSLGVNPTSNERPETSTNGSTVRGSGRTEKNGAAEKGKTKGASSGPQKSEPSLHSGGFCIHCINHSITAIPFV